MNITPFESLMMLNGAKWVQVEEEFGLIFGWKGSHTVNVYRVEEGGILHEVDCFTMGWDLNFMTMEAGAALEYAQKEIAERIKGYKSFPISEW